MKKRDRPEKRDVWKFVPSTSTWTKISPVSSSSFGYGGLGIDMQHPGSLVVAPVNLWWPDAELYRTTDGGATWHSADSGTTFTKLANVTQAYTIGFGKAAPGRRSMVLYITGIIGSITGIFHSDDAGEHWVRINDDRHQYGSINSAITGDPRVYGRVYVGTNGMGIVYGDITDDGGDRE